MLLVSYFFLKSRKKWDNGCSGCPTYDTLSLAKYDLRARTNSSVKAELGKQAAALIKDGDTVFMDASSTVRHIVDHIYPEQNLTIITNSMKVMEKLTENISAVT